MAEQIGIIQFKGTLGNLSGYQQDGKSIIRRKGGGTKEQFDNSPNMQRTRENASEFGRAAGAGKTLRTALRSLIQNVSDKLMTSRLTKAMLEVVQTDEINDRGQRDILDAETEMLEGFEFNQNGKLRSTFFAPIGTAINRATGAHEISIPAFIPTRDVVAPNGTTHLRLSAASAAVDFENETAEVISTETDYVPYSSTATAAQTLALGLSANSTHPIFVVAGIEFFQSVNGKYYPLQNGTYNALAILKVSGQ